MKIAVTTEENRVFQHFGKCESFTIFQTENETITSKSILDAGGSGHSALAALLDENHVDVLICGGIGQGAKDALQAHGVKLVAGANGNVDAVVKAYLSGNLVINPDFTCNHHHEDGHTCGEHHTCGGNCK